MFFQFSFALILFHKVKSCPVGVPREDPPLEPEHPVYPYQPPGPPVPPGLDPNKILPPPTPLPFQTTFPPEPPRKNFKSKSKSNILTDSYNSFANFQTSQD